MRVSSREHRLRNPTGVSRAHHAWPSTTVFFVSDVADHDCTYDEQKSSTSSVHPVFALWGTVFLHWLPSSAPLRDGASPFVHHLTYSSGLPRCLLYSYTCTFVGFRKRCLREEMRTRYVLSTQSRQNTSLYGSGTGSLRIQHWGTV